MLGFIAEGVRGLAARFAEFRARQIARAELESLDERTLADIGLRRNDIPMVLAGTFEPRDRADITPVAANLNTARRRAA